MWVHVRVCVSAYLCVLCNCINISPTRFTESIRKVLDKQPIKFVRAIKQDTKSSRSEDRILVRRPLFLLQVFLLGDDQKCSSSGAASGTEFSRFKFAFRYRFITLTEVVSLSLVTQLVHETPRKTEKQMNKAGTNIVDKINTHNHHDIYLLKGSLFIKKGCI